MAYAVTKTIFEMCLLSLGLNLCWVAQTLNHNSIRLVNCKDVQHDSSIYLLIGALLGKAL